MTPKAKHQKGHVPFCRVGRTQLALSKRLEAARSPGLLMTAPPIEAAFSSQDLHTPWLLPGSHPTTSRLIWDHQDLMGRRVAAEFHRDLNSPGNINLNIHGFRALGCRCFQGSLLLSMICFGFRTGKIRFTGIKIINILVFLPL